MKGRSVFAVEHGRSRLAAVGAAYAAFHGIAVLGILALLAVTAALDGHISLRPPSWLVDVAAPWVTVVLVGLGVLPALGIAAAVQVFEVRRGGRVVTSAAAFVGSFACVRRRSRRRQPGPRMDPRCLVGG